MDYEKCLKSPINGDFTRRLNAERERDGYKDAIEVYRGTVVELRDERDELRAKMAAVKSLVACEKANVDDCKFCRDIRDVALAGEGDKTEAVRRAVQLRELLTDANRGTDATAKEPT